MTNQEIKSIEKNVEKFPVMENNFSSLKKKMVECLNVQADEAKQNVDETKKDVRECGHWDIIVEYNEDKNFIFNYYWRLWS